jgi:hypothetical protein
MLKCCECYEKEVNRRKAQKAFLQLINKFDPTSQFLLLSRLIELAIKREIIFSTTLHEPQIIAWIVCAFTKIL